MTGSSLRMTDEDMSEAIEKAGVQLKERRIELDERFEDKKRKLTQGDNLAPGVSENRQGLSGNQTSYSAWRQDGWTSW